MVTLTKDIKMKDGICDSFIAYPKNSGKYPAVLFFMDAFGPRAHLYDMAKTIADKGFYVLLPNLFYRIRHAPVLDIQFPVAPEQMPAVRDKLMPLFQAFKPEEAVNDAAVFLDFLNRQPQVLPGTRFLTGYCMGGSMALRVAARYPDQCAAVASFHAGNLAKDEASPYKLFDRIKAKVYIAHADNDTSMPPDQIEKVEEALKKSGIRYETETYKGALHGFTMADLPMYNEAALKKHWEKLFEVFTI